MKIGLESLIKKYGHKNVMDTVARMGKKRLKRIRHTFRESQEWDTPLRGMSPGNQ